jgi:F-type H+-transporting ATPase subunit b
MNSPPWTAFRRRFVKFALAFAGGSVLGLAWALPLLAAEGKEHGNPWMDFLWKTINFAILAGVLVYLLRKPVAQFLRAAAQRAFQTLGDARASADLMDKRYQDQRRNLENLKSELERLRHDAHAETAAEAAQLKREAQEAADRLTSQIEVQAELSRRHALHSIRQELADEAVKLAESMIRERLDAKGQGKLLDDRIGQQERVS